MHTSKFKPLTYKAGQYLRRQNAMQALAMMSLGVAGPNFAIINFRAVQNDKYTIS